MVDQINHDAFSTTATVAGETSKGIAKGGLIAAAVGGGIVAAILGTASLFGLGIAAVPASIAIGAGALASFIGLGAPMAAIGGLFGLNNGGRRVNAESQAFKDRVRRNVENHEHKKAQTYNNGEIAGVQEGYQIGRADGEQVGFQKGQEFVVNQIQQHIAAQQQMAAQQVSAMEANSGPETKFADRVAVKCESKVDALNKDREASATASAHIG